MRSSPRWSRRGLITPQETKRAGRLPERTVYSLTDAGLIEAHDWLTDLISTPVKDYPSFEAALSFLPALPPDDVAELLHERAQRLELELAQAYATRELAEKHGLPRLFWVEAEFRDVLLEAELAYVRRLAQEIASGTLEGIDWWSAVHASDGDPGPAWDPPQIGEGSGGIGTRGRERGGRERGGRERGDRERRGRERRGRERRTRGGGRPVSVGLDTAVNPDSIISTDNLAKSFRSHAGTSMPSAG